MKTGHSHIALLVAFVFATGCGVTPKTAQLPKSSSAASGTTTNSVAAHLSTLSDDSMMGRGPGTAAYRAAANYVASQFAAAGLTGCGEGSWFQEVPLRHATLDSARTSVSLEDSSGERQELTFGRDYWLAAPFQETETADAEVAFAGEGIVAYAKEVDHYRLVDVRGKVVALLPGAPPGFSLDERSYFGAKKATEAEKRGAIGLVHLSPTALPFAGWSSLMREFAKIGSWTSEWDGKPEVLNPGLRFQLYFSPELSLSFGVSRTPKRIHLKTTSTLDKASSPNVLGCIRGSDAALAREIIVVTAHLDHLGVGPPVRGDSIYNGAVDNASGVAAIIEAARILAANPAKLRRTVMFAAVTGEEAGDIGSQYLLRHGSFAGATIVANVNVDGASVWPYDALVARGSEHSTLGAVLADGLAGTTVKLVPDPVATRAPFEGSDQETFVRSGIPAVSLAAARSGQARAQALNWLSLRYHQPADDMNQPLDIDALTHFAADAASVIQAIANDRRPIGWLQTDIYRPRGSGF